jgi:hypothetical protein
VEIKSLLEAIQATPWAVKIAESDLLFPTIETVHVLALTLVVGSISMVDLRLLGRSSHRGVKELSEEVLPWTWMAFVVAVISGSLMFSSAAVKYAYMPQFQVKLLLILLAGINMLVFHFLTYRSVGSWNHDSITPPSARLAGMLSLVFWIGVVTLGRWVGFV